MHQSGLLFLSSESPEHGFESKKLPKPSQVKPWGHKTNPANYRPISLTCIVCKTMEHKVYSQIMTHLDKHHILVEFLPRPLVQILYRHGHSNWHRKRLLQACTSFFSSRTSRTVSCETQLHNTVEECREDKPLIS